MHYKLNHESFYLIVKKTKNARANVKNNMYNHLFQCVLVFLYKAGNIIGKMIAAFSAIKLIIYSLFQ